MQKSDQNHEKLLKNFVKMDLKNFRKFIKSSKAIQKLRKHAEKRVKTDRKCEKKMNKNHQKLRTKIKDNDQK